MGRSETKIPAMNFKTTVKSSLPQGRNGKHKAVVTKILNDLDVLKGDSALKIPLTDLVGSKANVRSALNRLTRKRGRKVATATDSEFLYVWNEDIPEKQ
jgi:hypothetical protein